jgi:hypothetical protein
MAITTELVANPEHGKWRFRVAHTINVDVWIAYFL